MPQLERDVSPTITAWHVVQCKTRQEITAKDNLSRQRFEVYLPMMRCRHRRRYQWRDSIEALFPGYLFINVNRAHQSLSPVKSTHGVVGLVRFGDDIAVVEPAVIADLKRCEDSLELHSDPRRVFTAGETIEFIQGRFSGMRAVFAEQSGKRRAMVLMDLLGAIKRLRVPTDWLVKAS